MILLYFQLMTNYVLTYIGTRTGHVVQANPLMNWIFYLDFIRGFMISYFLSGLMILPLLLVKVYNRKIFRILMILVNILYSVVFVSHFNWIINTL